MTLDEAIKHATEVAEENQAVVDSCDYYGENMAKCEECAKEHRQLATWLRELKQLREHMSHSEKPNKWINKPQESENEKIIRISKGTLKARTGKYVIYDVEWLKTHFNTTEAKIYGQPNEDCISRKAVLDGLHSKFADGFDGDKWWNSTHVLNAINKVPSIAPQPKEEPQQKTGHWVLSGGYWRCSECKEKALLKLDKATGGYREYEPVRSKYCPNCGAKMQEVQE